MSENSVMRIATFMIRYNPEVMTKEELIKELEEGFFIEVTDVSCDNPKLKEVLKNSVRIR